VIEKHFTIDHDPGSGRPQAPATFRRAEDPGRIRESNAPLGDGAKRIMPSEAATAVAARRSTPHAICRRAMPSLRLT
jgi:sialic acid synthase SpsE